VTDSEATHATGAPEAEAGGPEAVGGDWRPVPASSILLRHDPVRDAELLVMPERIVVLNGQAAAIVRLCDGSRTVAQIVGELAGAFPGAPVEADVPEFVHRLREQGWLR
jgi:pyrroloquinoline quinone biosynthesis protein D